MDKFIKAITKPKKIDLGACPIYNAAGNLALYMSDAILQLVAAGGGSADHVDASSFWDAVKTNKQLVLTVPYDSSTCFVTQGVTVFRTTISGVPLQVSWSLMMNHPSLGLLEIKVNIARMLVSDKGGTVSVKLIQ